MSSNTDPKLSEKPSKCPRCNNKNCIRTTPAAYWCTKCTWSAGKLPPYTSPPVAERRDF